MKCVCVWGGVISSQCMHKDQIKRFEMKEGKSYFLSPSLVTIDSPASNYINLVAIIIRKINASLAGLKDVWAVAS